MTSEWLLILFSTVIALFAICVSVVITYLYFFQKRQISRRLQEAQVFWREKETGAIRTEQREIAQKEALTQLQVWREQELELARRQQLELSRSEAQVQFEQWKNTYTEEIRQDAIQKSQAVTVGKVMEHFVPYLPEFTYNPKDARFLGSPIDFVVFDGMDEGQVNNIILAEIKTGSSSLNTRERQIKEAVQAGRVQWIEIRPKLYISPEAIGHEEEKKGTDAELATEAEINKQSPNDKKAYTNRLKLIMDE